MQLIFSVEYVIPRLVVVMVVLEEAEEEWWIPVSRSLVFDLLGDGTDHATKRAAPLANVGMCK